MALLARRLGKDSLKLGAAFLLTAGLLTAAAWPSRAAAPANDMFGSPSTVAGRFGFVVSTNIDATLEDGEPDHVPDGSRSSVWYRWTAPRTGPVTIDTAHCCATRIDTTLAVYTGAELTSLRRVASNDDFGNLFSSRVRFRAVRGTSYAVAVGSGRRKDGQFRLHWAMTPFHDDFGSARRIRRLSGTHVSDNALATTQQREPRHGTRSIWYRWRAPRTAEMVFNARPVSFNAFTTVYRGRRLSRLTEVDFGNFGIARFRAQAGRTYRIAVASSFGPEYGSTDLHWGRARARSTN